MKDHADAAVGDNTEKKFKEYNDVLGDIEISLKSAAKLLGKSNDATYEALGKALELGQKFAGMGDDYAALKEAGVPMLGWGQFLTVVINFVILAFIIFMIVRYANKAMAAKEEEDAGPSEIDLLTEIRDSLKK